MRNNSVRKEDEPIEIADNNFVEANIKFFD